MWKASSKRHDYFLIFSPLASAVKGTDTAVNNALAFVYVGQNIRSEGILQPDCSGYSLMIPVLEILGLIRENSWYARKLFLTTTEGSNRGSSVLARHLETALKDITQMLQALSPRFLQFFIEELSCKPLIVTSTETGWGAGDIFGQVSHLFLLNNKQIMGLFEKVRNAFEEKRLAVQAHDYVSTRGGEIRELCFIFAPEAKQFLAECVGAKSIQTLLFNEDLELRHKLYHFLSGFIPRTGSIEALCEARASWDIAGDEVRKAISQLSDKGAIALNEDKGDYEIMRDTQPFYRRVVEESYFNPLAQFILGSG